MTAFADQVCQYQLSSRSCKSSILTVTISARRRPHPMSMASTARFRTFLSSSPTGAEMSVLPCSAESQFPTRTPSRFAPFTQCIPAARSGLRRPQSDASYASRRTAASLRFIVAGAYRRCSSEMRYQVTTVLLKARRGSEQYQSMKSGIAGSFKMFLGLFLFMLFAMAWPPSRARKTNRDRS